MIRIKAECKVLSIYADIMQEIDITVKEYYTDGRDNINQKALHNWLWTATISGLRSWSTEVESGEEWLDS